MKRFLCVITALAMILSFASCSKLPEAEKDTTTTTAKAPKVKEITKNAEFKDKNGRVVFTVEVTYPEISKNASESTLDYVNRVTAEVFEETCHFAQRNTENAAAFMDSRGSDTPWSKKITFESTYLSGKYVCFLVKESFSSRGEATAEPSFSTRCFDISKGLPCDIMYFSANPDASIYTIEDTVVPLVSQKALYDFYPSGMGLANLQMEKIPDIFDINNFFFTEEGMGFYFDRYLLDETLRGSYSCVIPWAELEGIFVHPESIA